MPHMFPAATGIVARWLTGALDVPVRWSVPTDRPDTFIVVRRSGIGPPSVWADFAQMDVEVWSGPPHASPKPAEDLAQQVRAHLEAMPEGSNPVSKVTITGMAFQPDPISRCPRMVIGCQVLIRAS